MTKRTITVDEYDIACQMMYQLTEILLAVGIVEIKISKKAQEIYWDTEGKGKIDSVELEKLSNVVERHYLDIAMRAKAEA